MKLHDQTVIDLIKVLVTAALTMLLISPLFAQGPTQTIRGVVTDKVSQAPLPGAVIIINTNPVKGATSDGNGRFLIQDIPVGRHELKVTYVGYKEAIIQNMVVNAGKETVLPILLEENIVQAEEVVIKAGIQKNKPLNELSTVSSRTFSVEETQRFAAAVNDPARMATSFAGVVGGHDGNNTISIRGNAPNALLWRMEGVDIPNPNHFSMVGTSGGGISILSAQLLSNSDFTTGAFASEYGNALGGVFDLRLRKGNNQKREYTLQASLLGLDVASEGPFKKGYDGSYLVNYRYSTLSMLGLMGVEIVGDATINYQDLSFNVSLPTKKWGTFGVFGFGGLSSQTEVAKRDSMLWKTEARKRYEGAFRANTGAMGLNHIKLFGGKSYLKTSLVFSGTDNGMEEEKLTNTYHFQRNYQESNLQTRLTFTPVYTYKINARNSIRTGLILSRLTYNLERKAWVDSSGAFRTYLSSTGSTSTAQAFLQWNRKVGSKVTTNVGIHTLYLNLNRTYSIEPRASVRYDLSERQYIAFGYGLHGQIQPLGTYFTKDAAGSMLNKNLEISKAHHFVLSHDFNFSRHTHIKTEIYYQHLFDIPVSIDASKNFSMLNVVEGNTNEILVNTGTGRNYGVEFTLERFLYRNFYYLLSLSLYESKYRAPDGTWFNTMFNTNYATTFTGGKEWELSEKRKRKVIGFNTKLVYVGGFRYTPIDLPASIAENGVVYDQTRAFEVKSPEYFRIDFRVSLKRNFTKITTTLSLDLQNATNRQNIAGQYFDKETGTIKYSYHAGLIPVLAYKVEF